MCLVVGVVASIYTLRFQLLIQGKGYGSYLASILNSVQILLFNFLYQYVINFLNDVENHRTDTDYEDAKISKLFVFQFINSYTSFFFLAYVAQYLPSADISSRGQCGAYTCMYPLQLNIAIIFGSRLVIQNTMEILLPVILQRMKLSSETKIRKAKEENPCCCCSCCSCDCAPGEVSKYRQPEDFLSLAELEYMKSKFDPINDVIKLYADTAIQFGYMIMFSTALPTASVCTLINNIVKLPLQYKQISNLYQRPIPIGAQDIGVWYYVFNIIVLIAIVTNAGIIVFTMNCLDLFSTEGRLWVFIGFIAVLTTLKFMLELFIPDIPGAVTIQLARKNLFVDAILKEIPPVGKSKVKPIVSPFDTFKEVVNEKPVVIFYNHGSCKDCKDHKVVNFFDDIAKNCERYAYFYKLNSIKSDILTVKSKEKERNFICEELKIDLKLLMTKARKDGKKKDKNKQQDVASPGDIEMTERDDNRENEEAKKEDEIVNVTKFNEEYKKHSHHKIVVYKFQGGQGLPKAVKVYSAFPSEIDPEFYECIGRPSIGGNATAKNTNTVGESSKSGMMRRMSNFMGFTEDIEGAMTLNQVRKTIVHTTKGDKTEDLPLFYDPNTKVKYNPDMSVPLPATTKFPSNAEFKKFASTEAANHYLKKVVPNESGQSGMFSFFSKKPVSP